MRKLTLEVIMRSIHNSNYHTIPALQKKLQYHQDQLFKYYSKLLILRIDFSYRKGTISSIIQDKYQLTQDMVDLMLQCEHYPGIVGEAWVMEKGITHGIHTHAIFYINGQKHKSIWNFWNEINYIWKKITLNEGYAHHCKNKEYYKVKGEKVISSDDINGRYNCAYILDYLAKKDQKEDINIHKLSKLPINNHKRRGRPRKNTPVILKEYNQELFLTYDDN